MDGATAAENEVRFTKEVVLRRFDMFVSLLCSCLSLTDS